MPCQAPRRDGHRDVDHVDTQEIGQGNLPQIASKYYLGEPRKKPDLTFQLYWLVNRDL